MLFKSFCGKVSIKKLILALVILKIIGVGNLIYIDLIDLKGFYKEAFR